MRRTYLTAWSSIGPVLSAQQAGCLKGDCDYNSYRSAAAAAAFTAADARV
jgi:hypothetical protein